MKKLSKLLIVALTICTLVISAACGAPQWKYELNDDGVTYKLVDVTAGLSSSCEIPEEYNDLPVTVIGTEAFAQTPLKSIVISDSIGIIEEKAFAGCEKLESIKIPNNVISMGRSAFHTCTNLKSASIGSGLKKLLSDLFYDCKSLASVTFEASSLTELESGLFSNCTSLTSINIPNGVTILGSNLFSGCTALETVSLPNTLTNIGARFIQSCDHLTSITFNGKKEQWSTVYKDSDWLENSALKSIVCSDGTITL